MEHPRPLGDHWWPKSRHAGGLVEGSLSPSCRSPTQTSWTHSDRLIYKGRQIGSTFHLIWVSLGKSVQLVYSVSLCSRGLDSLGCHLVGFWLYSFIKARFLHKQQEICIFFNLSQWMAILSLKIAYNCQFHPIQSQTDSRLTLSPITILMY